MKQACVDVARIHKTNEPTIESMAESQGRKISVSIRLDSLSRRGFEDLLSRPLFDLARRSAKLVQAEYSSNIPIGGGHNHGTESSYAVIQASTIGYLPAGQMVFSRILQTIGGRFTSITFEGINIEGAPSIYASAPSEIVVEGGDGLPLIINPFSETLPEKIGSEAKHEYYSFTTRNKVTAQGTTVGSFFSGLFVSRQSVLAK